MRLTGYPFFFLTVSRLQKSGGLNNPTLHDISVVVHLINIPAHSGIYGNDTADKLAREVAYKISIGIICAPNVISVSDAYSLSAEIAHKYWQHK